MKYNREEFQEVIVDIGRVTKVVKGGRRFRFTALVVVGYKKGKIPDTVCLWGDSASGISVLSVFDQVVAGHVGGLLQSEDVQDGRCDVCEAAVLHRG